MGFGYLIAAFVFLFNPNINIVDILPDFIGYLLIYWGLSKASFLIDKLEEAKTRFWKLSLVGIAKFAAILLLPVTDDTFTLVLTFSFGVIELMYLIPAFGFLIDGFVYSGTRYNGTGVFKNSDKVKSGCFIFFIIRAVCAVLPELTSLSLHDNLGSVSAIDIDITRYKPAFLVVALIISGIYGIIWLAKSSIYISGIRKDKVYIDNFEREYNENIVPNEKLFIKRNMKAAMALMIIAAIASFDLYVDGINIISDVITASFLISAVVCMRKYTNKFIISVFVSSVYGIVSLINFVISLVFNMNYSMSEINWVSEADDFYNIIKIISTAESILYLISFGIVFSILASLAAKHTDQILGVGAGVRVSSYNRETIKYLTTKLNIGLGLILLNAAVGIVYVFTVVNFAEIWIISSLIGIVSIIYLIHVFNQFNENIYNVKD